MPNEFFNVAIFEWKKITLKISIADFDCSLATVNDWCKTNSMYTFAKKKKKQKVKMKKVY